MRPACPLAQRPAARVTLAGAGPGDPDLLTVKAARALAAASLVLYDHLVSPEVLALAPPGAELVDVGTLATLPTLAHLHGVKAPALIIIGGVVLLHAQLGGLMAKSLQGVAAEMRNDMQSDLADDPPTGLEMGLPADDLAHVFAGGKVGRSVAASA